MSSWTTELLQNYPSQVVSADVVGKDINVSQFTAVQIEIDCTSASTPINVVVERRGHSGVYYPLFAVAPTVAGGAKLTILIAPGAPGGTTPHLGVSELPGEILRVTFDVTGSTTFSADIVGR